MRSSDYEAMAHYWVAFYYMWQNQLQKAKQAATQTLLLVREAKDSALEMRTQMLIADISLGLGDYPGAIREVRDVLQLAADTNSQDYLAQATAILEDFEGKAPLVRPAEDRATPADRRQHLVLDVHGVEEVIRKKVRHLSDSIEHADSDVPLLDLGIDSLASVELRTSIQKEFSINLPPSVMFDFPTITGLAYDTYRRIRASKGAPRGRPTVAVRGR